MFAPPPLRRTLEAAFRDLGARDAAVRESAVRDLASYQHELEAGELRARAIAALESRLAEDDHASVRSSAAVALADLRAYEAATKLLVAVEDAHGHVRQMALAALGEIGVESSLPRVERALGDERPEVRYQATIAYFRLCSDPARRLAVLREKLTDDDDAIRYIALRLAEEHLGGSRSAEVLELAAACLADPAGEVVLAAAILLGHAGDRRSAEVLSRVVRTGSASVKGGAVAKEDECEALELVGRLGMRELIPDLERRAFGFGRFLRDTGSLSAKVGLARMGHKKAIDALANALASSSVDTRTLATVASGRTARSELRQALEHHRAHLDAELLTEALTRLQRDLDTASADSQG